MSLLVTNCPRCGAKEITFDLIEQVEISTNHGWQKLFEVFCICRACFKPTIFRIKQKDPIYVDIIEKGLKNLKVAVNDIVAVERYVGIQDNCAGNPPEHLPEDIDAIFKEGAACMSIGCNNAAGTMFRLCLDLATQSLLPDEVEGPNNKIRRNLGLRLPWLFDNNILPEALRDLSTCIKDDGNDGAHEGTLTQQDAADILDFTFILLERLYTEPKRLEIAAQRRLARRTSN